MRVSWDFQDSSNQSALMFTTSWNLDNFFKDFWDGGNTFSVRSVSQGSWAWRQHGNCHGYTMAMAIAWQQQNDSMAMA